MTGPTRTKRPLRKGDPCWVRLQGKGQPVRAEYLKPSALEKKGHIVLVGGKKMMALHGGPYGTLGCRFVAKPVEKNHD